MKTQRLFNTSVGRKIITAISGIVLLLFLVVHLGGNLTLFISADLFNSYSHHLISLGPALYVVEAVLLAFFLFHIVYAISVQVEKWRARPDGYAVEASKGAPSHKTFSSRSMIVTGLVILVFTVIHLKKFKYGPAEAQGYVALIHGQQVRDIYRLVIEEFKRPIVAFGYAAVMLLIGMHLRHGFWSSLQSLGAMSPRLSPVFYTLGLVFAILLAGGFLVLPLWIYFFVPLPVAGGGL